MNLWECDHRDEKGVRCKTTAVGVGGAIGLLAIGWHFTPGATLRPTAGLIDACNAVLQSLADPSQGFRLLCPAHRPDPVPPRERSSECRRFSTKGAAEPCSQCRAEIEAKRLQELIAERSTRPA